jgi:homoserine dehydrogenase
MDVDGSDAAQKLAILAHLSFGSRAHWRDIPRMGLDAFDLSDLNYASQLGYRIKLVASANLTDDGLELIVAPTLVKKGQPLAEVRGAYNAITVVGDAVGDIFFHGQGAGQMPTASAVVADMIDTAVGRTDITFRTLELWSNRDSKIPMKPFAKLMSRYYLRLCVSDRPGVLAEITGILGKHDISIASVIQHEAASGGSADTVALVIMTHKASEGSAQAALDKIQKLATVHGKSIRLRVMER